MSDSEEIHSTPTEQASTEVDSPNASDSEEVQPSNTKKTYQACRKANSLVNCSSSTKKPDAPYKPPSKANPTPSSSKAKKVTRNSTKSSDYEHEEIPDSPPLKKACSSPKSQPSK